MLLLLQDKVEENNIVGFQSLLLPLSQSSFTLFNSDSSEL